MENSIQKMVPITSLALVLVLVFSVTVSLAAPEDDVGSDVDRLLLEELDAADDSLQDLPAKPAAKVDKPGGADEPSAREQESQDQIDQQLLDQLDAGEDIPRDSDEDEVVSALGEEADPVTIIGEKMRLVERLLVKETSQQRTRKLQDEIVRDLAELLKKMEQQQQSASSNTKPQPRQQASRNKLQQPKPRSGEPQRGPAGRQSTKPAQESDDQVRKAEDKKIDVIEMTEIIKREWGHLPEKDRRELLRQFGNTEALPESALSIEKYFRRLSETDEE